MFACWADNLQHKHKFECHHFLNECKVLTQTLWHYLTIFILDLTLNDHALYYCQSTCDTSGSMCTMSGYQKITLYFESASNSYRTAALCTLLIYSQIMLVWTDQVSATSFPQSSSQLWTSQHENWNKQIFTHVYSWSRRKEKWPKRLTDH
jgi:hypothetical protein